MSDCRFPYPEQVVARALVLNMLRFGPAFLADVLGGGKRDGISAREIEKAARWLGVIEKDIGGAIVWERPTRLAAIWWSPKRQHLFKWRPSVMACA